jgi:hypothetical protein
VSGAAPLLGFGLMLAALVPLAFLIYTLTHLEELGVPLLHGRVIVEALCVLALGGAGLYLLTHAPS